MRSKILLSFLLTVLFVLANGCGILAEITRVLFRHPVDRAAVRLRHRGAAQINFVADLEALHPYLRINSIESKLQGAIRCPVVVLYPGKREGKTSLRFLEFYPADPNYRSEHIG